MRRTSGIWSSLGLHDVVPSLHLSFVVPWREGVLLGRAQVSELQGSGSRRVRTRGGTSVWSTRPWKSQPHRFPPQSRAVESSLPHGSDLVSPHSAPAGPAPCATVSVLCTGWRGRVSVHTGLRLRSVRRLAVTLTDMQQQRPRGSRGHPSGGPRPDMPASVGADPTLESAHAPRSPEALVITTVLDFVSAREHSRGRGRRRGPSRLPAKQGAGCGTRSQDPEIMTSVEGRRFTNGAPGTPSVSVLVVRFCLMRSQVPCGTCVFLTVPPARLFAASRSSIGGRLLFTPKRGRAFGRSPASGFSLLSSQFPQLKPGAVLLAPLQVHLPAPTGAGGRQIPCPRALPGPRMATSSTSWAAPAVTRTRCRARPGPWLPPTLVPVPQRGLLPPSV
ncbi:protein CLN8 isoform X3 [Mustela putorius furo]|uniref:Protein CLN8 isoform X3 n=1 Tax=Mustela putorius furo TaxID=9669 RepID=A0A8U0SG56_MUSPF|nr:protein CLN8 isoform X3 [Mustela putorius furo]